MKKTGALLLVLLLLAGVACASEVAREAFAGGFSLDIPAAWARYEPTAEDLEEGICWAAGDGDALEVRVYQYAGEDMTAQQLYEEFVSDGERYDVRLGAVGETRVVAYRLGEEMLGIALPGTDGCYYDVRFIYDGDLAMVRAVEIVNTLLPVV